MFPRPDAAPLPHLAVYTDGLKCLACGYICRHVKYMQEHGRTHHSWVYPHTRRTGRPAATQQRWAGGVVYQKFQSTSTLGRLFEIQGVTPAEPNDGNHEKTQLKRALTVSATQIDQVVESKSASNIIEEDSSRWGYQT